MSLEITKKIRIVNPYSNIDEFYGPYENLEEALLAVPLNLRKLGRTLGINTSEGIKEFWWVKELGDNGLVEKLVNTTGYIPLTGTKVNADLTGTIVVSNGINVPIFSQAISGIINSISFNGTDGLQYTSTSTLRGISTGLSISSKKIELSKGTNNISYDGQTLTANHYIVPINDNDFVQKKYIVDFIINQNSNKVEEEINVTQSMISGTSVTFPIGELIDPDKERTIYYNGVFIAKSMSTIDVDNKIIVNLGPLQIEPIITDSIVIRYFKK